MEWLEPWYSVADDAGQVTGMADELRRELAPGHALYDIPVRTLARRQDCDDVLFALEDGSNRVAVVHLTWRPTSPEQLPWPVARIFTSLDAWNQQVQLPDHERFSA